MKLQPSGGGFFFFFSHKHIGSGSVNAVEQRPLKSSAEAKNRLNNVFLSFLFCSHSAEIYRAFGEKKKGSRPDTNREHCDYGLCLRPQRMSRAVHVLLYMAVPSFFAEI